MAVVKMFVQPGRDDEYSSTLALSSNKSKNDFNCHYHAYNTLPSSAPFEIIRPKADSTAEFLKQGKSGLKKSWTCNFLSKYSKFEQNSRNGGSFAASCDASCKQSFSSFGSCISMNNEPKRHYSVNRSVSANECFSDKFETINYCDKSSTSDSRNGYHHSSPGRLRSALNVFRASLTLRSQPCEWPFLPTSCIRRTKAYDGEYSAYRCSGKMLST